MNHVSSGNAILLLLVAVLCAGCQQKMAVQPSLRPFEGSTLFEDGRAARPLVEGTVPRGHLRDDVHLYTGRLGRRALDAKAAAVIGTLAGAGAGPATSAVGVGSFAFAGEPYAAEFPFPVTEAVMQRGRERFGIFCAVCHDQTASGNGIVARRGLHRPPSLHSDRLRQAPAGYIFNVITNGYGAMPDHAQQIPVRDRWTIVAYVRALQLSQHAPLEAVPAAQRERLTRKGAAR